MNIVPDTKRLLLMELLLEDVDFYALDANPEVHRYLGNNSLTSE